MRSSRGFFAALTLLLAIPIALAGQLAFAIDFEISFHFLLALAALLVASAVSDFKLPPSITWLGRVSSGSAAVVFLLQGVSSIIVNDTLSYVAYQVLGQRLEAMLVDGAIFWFVGLCLWDSQGATRLFGFAAVAIVVCFELYRYRLAYIGAEPEGFLKLTLLLPFVWLLLESRKS